MKKQLRKDEIEEFDKQVFENYNLKFFLGKKKVESTDDSIIIDSKEVFIKKDGLLIPSLRSLQDNCFLKKVVVDRGAIPFVCKGADIMRPGIVEFDSDINKNDIVAVVDVTHKKPIAVGKMIMSGDEAKLLSTGRIVQNIHFVGDLFWNRST